MTASLVVGGALLLLPGMALACPLCAESLPSAQNVQPGASAPALAEGVYYSILFMLAMIFAVPASIGTGIYLVMRKHAPPGLNDTQPQPPSKPQA